MIKRSVLSLGTLAAWRLIAAAFAQLLWELGLLPTIAPALLDSLVISAVLLAVTLGFTALAARLMRPLGR